MEQLDMEKLEEVFSKLLQAQKATSGTIIASNEIQYVGKVGMMISWLAEGFRTTIIAQVIENPIIQMDIGEDIIVITMKIDGKNQSKLHVKSFKPCKNKERRYFGLEVEEKNFIEFDFDPARFDKLDR